MSTVLKIFGVLVALLIIGAVTGGFLLGHTEPCGPAAANTNLKNPMKAVTYRCYGSPDVLEFGDVETPGIGPTGVLVKVEAAAVNPLDYHYMRGTPYFMRMSSGLGTPEDERFGVDFSGTVAAIGSEVTRYQVGDRVFGGGAGAFAEYLSIGENRGIAKLPDSVSFEAGGTVAIAALTALQGLRDLGDLQPGQRVLINGASGGVGTYAVQIAKALGAGHVTGVCSGRNVELVRSLGADRVIDYTEQSFIDLDDRYDVILDNVGNHPLSAIRGVLNEHGKLIIIGGPKTNQWLGPLMRPIAAGILSPFVSQDLVMLLAELNGDDLSTVGQWMANGTVTAVIDRQYSLADVPDAIRYSETGRARGKILITVGKSEPKAM